MSEIQPPASQASVEVQIATEKLFAWARQHGALGLQLWVADDLGFHPHTVFGDAPGTQDRDLARQCCVLGEVVVQEHRLAVALTLSDRCSGAVVFVLTPGARPGSSTVFQARVDAMSYQIDTALHLQRVERLSGVARKSHFLRSTLGLAHSLEQCERLRPVLQQLHVSLGKLMPVENFFVATVDAAQENLIIEFSVDQFDNDESPIPLLEGRLQGSLAACVVSSGRVMRGSSRELLTQLGHGDRLGTFGPQAHDWLGVPMMAADQAIGVVVTQSYDPERGFADGDSMVLAMVAEAMAAALMRRRVRESLEQTVLERTLQIEKTNQALQDTVTTLEQAMNGLVQAEKLASLGSMVAGISHELNTPIGNALTVATALEHRFAALAADMAASKLTRSKMDSFVVSGQEMADLITRSVQRASALLIRFKQVAVDQTSAQRRVFDLNQVVEDILTTLRPGVERADIAILNHVPPDIECDSFPGPLEQVLASLVHNAVVHGLARPGEGTVTLRAKLEGDQVSFTVADDGVGMAPHVLARAFDPFFTTQLGRGGSGIGLAVCHRIVTSVLGGSIVASSSPDAGTTVTLEFPAKAANRM